MKKHQAVMQEAQALLQARVDARVEQEKKQRKKFEGSYYGARTLREQITRVLQQHGGAEALQTQPAQVLSSHDYLGQFPKEKVNLTGWKVNTWMTTIAERTYYPVVPARPSVCKVLVLKKTNIDDTGVKALRKIPLLQELDLSGCLRASLTDASLLVIQKYLPQLHRLNISECPGFTAEGVCGIWDGCQRLQHLICRHSNAITDHVLQIIATTVRKPGYECLTLDVGHCRKLTGAGILALSESANVKLHTWKFDSCMNITSMALFGFEQSMSLHTLRDLDLSSLRIDRTGISWLVAGKIPLTSLNLAECTDITDFCLALLSRCPDLEQLNFSGCNKITNKGLVQLLRKSPKEVAANEEEQNQDSDSDSDEEYVPRPLRKIWLKSCTLVGNVGMEVIAKACPKLQVLDLRGCPRVEDQGMIAIAKGCPHLSEVYVAGCGNLTFYGQPNIADESLIFLAKLCRRLRKLDCSGCSNISDAGVVAIARTCKDLQLINLTGTRTTDLGIFALAAHATKLESVSISQLKQLTSRSIEALAQGLDNLQTLSAQYCRKLDDTALRALSQHAKQLQSLNLSGNDAITEVGVDSLCHGCCNLRSLKLKECGALTRSLFVKSVQKHLAFSTASPAKELTTIPKPLHYMHLVERLIEDYKAALILQSYYRRWQQRQATIMSLSRRRHRRQKVAACKIQRCARNYLQWKSYLHMLSCGRNVQVVIYVQAHIRGLLSRLESKVYIFIRLRAIRCIQRGYRVRYAYINATALTIQRIYRGYLGRLIYWHLVFEKECEAAWSIYEWYRRCMTRYEFKQRCIRLVRGICSMQQQCRVYLARKHLREHLHYYRQYVIRIQCMIRKYLAICYVQQRRIAFNAGALNIQRVYRGFLDRKYVKQYRALASQAATAIQTQFRRHRARKNFLLQRASAIIIQRAYRFVCCRRKFYALWSDLHAKWLYDSATEIQRTYRGHLGKRRAILFRKIHNCKARRKGQNIMHWLMRRRLIRRAGAIIIQRFIRRKQCLPRIRKFVHFRKFQARMLIQRHVLGWYNRVLVARKKREMVAAALDIERVFRGHCGRNIYRAKVYEKLLKDSATLIQSIIRMFLGKCFVQHRRELDTWAAGMLQRVYRGRLGRQIATLRYATKVMEDKEEYLKSVKGKFENAKNELEDKFARDFIRREVNLIKETHAEWTRRRDTLALAVKPIKKEHGAVLKRVNDAVSENLRLYRKLIGVTENVYTGNQDLEADTIRNEDLTKELSQLQFRIMEFKYLIRQAIKHKRVLEPTEFWEIAQEVNLMENVPLT